MKNSILKCIWTAACLMLASGATAQPNATWYQSPNWSFPVVPTSYLHSPPYVWLSPELFGNSAHTYWNAAGINNGSQSIPAGMVTAMYLDGLQEDYVTWASIPTGSPYYTADRGPITVRGGRHVMSVLHDANGFIAETNENDNAWGRQFVWRPGWWDSFYPVSGVEPPDPHGGWDHLSVPALGNNCDGYGFSTESLEWSAVAAYSLDNSADYDLFMYDPPANWGETAFTNPITYSNLGAGYLDFVLANPNQVGLRYFLAGVEKYSGSGDFIFSYSNHHNEVISPGGTRPSSLGLYTCLQIIEMEVGPGDVGPMLVGLDAQPGSSLAIAIFDPSFTVGRRLDASVTMDSQPDGTLRFPFDFAAPGNYALVVYRDPVNGVDPVDFTLTVNQTAVDLAPGFLATWHSPLVPRPDADGTPQSVPMPPWLTGWGPSTYFNFAVVNNGPEAVDGVRALCYMDGLRTSSEHSFFRTFVGSADPGGYLIANNIPRNMVGGRHTWTLEVDPNNTVTELSESNNIWGEQYVWYGLSINYDLYGWEGTVAAQTGGGWDTITSGEPMGLNCNGYRLPDAPLGWWRAVALAHDPAEDLDLALHLPATGPKDGYYFTVASSAFGQGFTDFVVVNENLGVYGDIDMGVQMYEGSSGYYQFDAVESATVYDPTTTPIGPLELGEFRLLHIYDMYFGPGTYSVQLENMAGNVDWGIQLMLADQQYQGRLNHVIGAVAFGNGPGQGESFQMEIINPGWYGLVVYKSKVQDIMVPGTYRVHISSGASPAPDQTPPTRTDIAGISPNPFNPSTEITFELGQAGTAKLDIYNVQGALVRTLVSAQMEAGSHVLQWDGLDGSGRRVSSGVYMARLRAGGVETMAKMMMLK